MSAVLSFDTLRFANKLKAAGISQLHAEAEAEALAEVFEVNAESLADKEDLKQLEDRVDNKFDLSRKDIQALELQINNRFEKMSGEINARFGEVNARFEKVDGKMLLLQWMMGFLLVGVGSLILKAFF